MMVVDLKTGKRTFAGETMWEVIEQRALELARHYRKHLGVSWSVAQAQAWAVCKELVTERFGCNVMQADDVPAFLRRRMGW